MKNSWMSLNFPKIEKINQKIINFSDSGGEVLKFFLLVLFFLTYIFQSARFTQTMAKFYQFELKERTITGCTEFARSGDPDDFVAPVFNGADLCASLDSFFLSMKSYHDAYACIAGIDQTDLELKHLRPHVVENVIQRQRFKLLTIKLVDLDCTHASGFLPTLPGFEETD
jgi:hypothetical protein